VNNFTKRIKALEEKLKNLDALLDITEQEVNKLQSERQLDKTKIKSQQKELEDWKQKLEACQQEKTAMERELKEQIIELKKPELSENEKWNKINGLLDGQKQDLEKLEQHLCSERTHYWQIRDKLTNKLLEPCEVCLVKEQNLQQKEKKIYNLFITIWIILGLSFIFCSLFTWFVMSKYTKRVKKAKLFS